MLEAITKLYYKLGYEEPDILQDVRNLYLTEHTARNGRPVLWYIDDTQEAAIYTDNEEFLTPEEIEKELT